MDEMTCWLVFDEIGANFPGVEAPVAESVTAIRLASYQPSAGTTEWLRYRDVTADRIQVVSRSGAWQETLPCTPHEPVWTQLPFDKRVGVRHLSAIGFPAAQARPRLVPAFLVTEEPVDGAVRSHVYSCSRIRESGLLFSRIWSSPVIRSGTGEPGRSPVTSIRTACQEQPELLRRFTDEAVQMTRFEDDVEIELKLTLLEPGFPWEIACKLADAVQARKIPGFIPDLGNEMQRWTYDQHTFEVLAPADKIGYIAFMHDASGTYTAKYKFFAADALRRTEKFDVELKLEPAGFVDFLRSKFGELELRPLPQLVRTRFDVNVESARTGHFYGLEMDEVRAGGRVLQQLEIEYHRTRACYGVAAATVEPELVRLSEEAQGLLEGWDIKTGRGYLSKLSFLKEVAAVA